MVDNIGILGIIHLVIILWAGINIVQSRSEPLKKALWLVLVLVLPIVGLIIWILFGPRSAR